MSGHRTAEETARLGDRIYEREIREQVETEHHGEVVAIDVNSGRWAIGENVIAARELLRKRQPQAADVWLLRVGHRSLHRFGGRSLGSAK